ncbi:MAG TPA: MupA/Atu3671 family FMN-dependent luciferase-like monooxygenase [Blastocatellia bacterium]
MADYTDRLEALTPAQRALLEARLKRKGLNAIPRDGSSDKGLSAMGPILNAESGFNPNNGAPPDRRMKFSLYFFSDDGEKLGPDKYTLLIEAAKFADANGFSAVWTPERHFQRFGGLFPNPSVTGAALAVATNHVQIRAGSVAIPLHHPVRVAEEWSVVDNLSNGRVAISIASGWHPNDFVFTPSIYDDRKQAMYDHVETIQKLWAGEELEFPGPNESSVTVRVLPRPIQPRLPLWVTTAGNPQTWVKAGEIGANVLAALAGYSDSDMAENIQHYRQSRRDNGHVAEDGIVSVMVHTYIGDDEAVIKEEARAPMCHYLRSYFDQLQNLGAQDATEDDKRTLVAAAFEQYYPNHLLIGTKEKCRAVVDRLQGLGVDEIACLIDFGIEREAVLNALVPLAELARDFSQQKAVQVEAPVPVAIGPDGGDHAQAAKAMSENS